MPTPNPEIDAPANRDDLPELGTGRIVSRRHRADDLDDLYAVHADAQVMRYWSFPPWTQLSQARAQTEQPLNRPVASAR